MQTAVNGGSELLICVPGAVHGLSATPTVPSCLSLAGVLQHSTPTHAAWRPPANLADFQQCCDRVHLDRHRVPFTPEPDVGQIVAGVLHLGARSVCGTRARPGGIGAVDELAEREALISRHVVRLDLR